eukprot:CAMPEP_0198526128 /NCGR_PEP_ID=MMETSP1462-20131121/23775_1 /TAXON_ID=1333877 /ORGANISM="Brandtodinium nutriculum, Strain RCC3387" /LENGTH=69 /DNA_ID=CAMNT_0044255897 /DNA_START=88 /DNA_END=293 /DNA_ORIENTATION=-
MVRSSVPARACALALACGALWATSAFLAPAAPLPSPRFRAVAAPAGAGPEAAPAGASGFAAGAVCALLA